MLFGATARLLSIPHKLLRTRALAEPADREKARFGTSPDSGFSERTGCKLKPVRSSGGKLADDRRIGIFA
jgi:hypothetical protein